MIYFYYGSDIYSLEEHLRLFKERYFAKFPSGTNFYNIDAAENIEQFGDIVKTHSMFEEKKLVFVSNVLGLAADGWEEIETVIKSYKLKESGDIVVVFYERKDEAGAIKSKKQFDYFKKNAKVKVFSAPTGTALVRWVEKLFELRGGTVEKDAAVELVEYVGSDTLRLSNEISKLVLYKGKKSVNLADVRLLIVKPVSSQIFKTLESLSRRNAAESLLNLNTHMKAGEDPLQILSMLAYQVRTLLSVKQAQKTVGNNSPAIAKLASVHPFVAKKTISQTEQFSFAELVRLHAHIVDADVQIKTGQKDPADALEDCVYAFISR